MTDLQIPSFTYSGELIDLGNIADHIDKVQLDDVTIPLTRIPRFGGVTVQPFTVAQHSLATMLVVESLADHDTKRPSASYVPLRLDSDDSAWALFHDSAEALLGDIRKPLKDRLMLDNGTYLPEYLDDLEEDILFYLAARVLDLPISEDSEYGGRIYGETVHLADMITMAAEAWLLMPPGCGTHIEERVLQPGWVWAVRVLGFPAVRQAIDLGNAGYLLAVQQVIGGSHE